MPITLTGIPVTTALRQAKDGLYESTSSIDPLKTSVENEECEEEEKVLLKFIKQENNHIVKMFINITLNSLVKKNSDFTNRLICLILLYAMSLTFDVIQTQNISITRPTNS